MSDKASQSEIVVVGAGIIGLYVSLALVQRGHGRSITVIAEHLPGDTATTYTSPWAGCNFSAISGTDPNALRWDRAGYQFLREVAATVGDEAFVKKTPSTEFWDAVVPEEKIKTMAEYLDDFQVIPKDNLPQGVSFGISFSTVTIHAPKFMVYLYNRLKREGVQFVRKRLDSIASAYTPSTKVVFNCTGNAAKFLPGVEDAKCYPTRGQVVLVRAPRVKVNMMRHGSDYETYIIPRPGTNGHVILGGYMQKGVNDGSTYATETESILQRTKDLSEDLRAEEPEVLGVVSGMRPSREGGARVEREEILLGNQHRALVHNYGAGGTGYQAGWGMAIESINLAQDILCLDRSHPRPRL